MSEKGKSVLANEKTPEWGLKGACSSFLITVAAPERN
jgi:hypothetical protein